jgi:hypothetical protein
MRKEPGKAVEAENLEFAYRRSMKWMERHAPGADEIGSQSS